MSNNETGGADNKNLLNGLSTLIALQIIGVLALIVSFWVLHQDLLVVNEAIVQVGQKLAGGQGAVANVGNWREHIRSYNASIGPADADVVITVYSDFQCPFCKSFAQSTHKEMLAELGDEVKVVFKNLPLVSIHPQAMISAIAAQCANQVGSFWKLHDLLFEQDSLSTDSILALGASLNDGESYRTCVLGEKTRSEVEQDIADAVSAGIAGTPTFVINGEVLQGAPAYSTLKRIVELKSEQVSQL